MPSEEIVRLSHVILEAIVARDGATLDACFDDEFVALAPAGGRLDRGAFIRSILDAPYTVTAASFESLEIELFDRIAVAVGIQRAEARLATGETVTSRGAFTDVFVLTASGWRLRLAHAMELP